MEISFCSHPICREVITRKFSTWHNSIAAMAYTKFCSDMIACNGVEMKQNLYRISIMMAHRTHFLSMAECGLSQWEETLHLWCILSLAEPLFNHIYIYIYTYLQCCLRQDIVQPSIVSCNGAFKWSVSIGIRHWGAICCHKSSNHVGINHVCYLIL